MKNTLLLLQGFILAFTSFGFTIPAHTQGLSYPDAALVDAASEEDRERQKLEELEAKAAIERDRYEKRRREVEMKVSAHKYNIEGLKMQQEKAQGELETLKTEIAELDSRIDSLTKENTDVAEKNQKTIEHLDQARAEIDQKLKNYDNQFASAQKARRDYENSIYNKSIEVQRMRTELAQAETRIQEAEAKRANLEAEEQQTRTVWMQTKLNIADKVNQKNESLNELKLAKDKHASALRDLAVARKELADAERSRAQTAQKVKSDIQRFEGEILAASKSRVSAEAEAIRLETEASKLRDYASRIKANRDEAVEKSENASSMVLKTRIAVATARSELGQEIQAVDQDVHKASKSEALVRGLAAADEASALFSGARRWVSSARCKFFSKPMSSSSVIEEYGSGRRAMARETNDSRWVEVISGSGVSTYVESRCGRFEN